MEAETNYWLIWLIYLAAGIVFYAIFWLLTNFSRALWLSYALRSVMAALIVTPWYASERGETLAPALIVVLLDAITIGGGAASRGLVPLLSAVTGALLLATGWYFFKKISNKKYLKQEDT